MARNLSCMSRARGCTKVLLLTLQPLTCTLLLLRTLFDATTSAVGFTLMILIFTLSTKHENRATMISKLESCVRDIKSWSIANNMKLNDDKTKIIHLSSRFRSLPPVTSVNIGDVPIQPVRKDRNLGVTFDNNLKMDSYVNNICRAAFLSLP